MATTPAPLRKVREICLSLDDTSEAVHAGKPAFLVGKRMFATCGNAGGRWRLVVQLEPDHADALIESGGRFERYPRAPSCVSVDVSKVEDWEEIRALVLESYRLASHKRQPRRR